jgi:6-phosphogluconolactonase
MLSTLPEGCSGTSWCADVHVSASGKHVYGSNRGHDSIAIFAADAATGRLSPIGFEPTRGKFPRNFALDPSGTFLLAANQDSDSIVTFRIDPETGRLAATGHVTETPKPVCLKLI